MKPYISLAVVSFLVCAAISAFFANYTVNTFLRAILYDRDIGGGWWRGDAMAALVFALAAIVAPVGTLIVGCGHCRP